MMSGLGVIDDTCHQKAKTKGDTWEPCVTPQKKNQVVIRPDEGKKERKKKGKGKKKRGEERRSDRQHFLRSLTKRRSKLVGARGRVYLLNEIFM